MLISACIPEPESPTIEVSENSQLMKVREWFEENKTMLRLPERGSNFRTDAQELTLPFFEKEPDWDQFHHYYFPDGREVFEINLENAETYIPISDASEDIATQANRSIQNILFVKHPTENRFDPLIARYYPDEESSKREFKEISYQTIDEKWSGWIDLFTYDEHYFIGFQVEKGQITNTRKFQKEDQNAKKAIGFENKDVRCYIKTVDYYSVSGGYKQYMETTHEQVCALDGHSQYSGSPSYNYGGYPSGEGSAGVGSSNPVPDDVPAPNLRIEIDRSFSDNPYLSCILEKLQLSKFVNDLALLDGTSQNGRNVILKVGHVPKRSGYMEAANAETNDDDGPYRIQIVINEERVNLGSLELARIILHEIIHAELFVANFHKGGSPIDGNFQANFNMYMETYHKGGNSVIQHNYMAEKMVDKMANVLSQIHSTLGKDQFISDPDVIAEFQNKRMPSDFYKGLAWSGLQSTDMWKYNLPARNTYLKYQELADAKLNNECNSN
jgi:hypothetical protein